MGWPTSKAVWDVLKPRGRAMRNAPTAAEAAMWDLIKQDKLGGQRFRRQKAIGKFIVDFYCANAGLVIEVDGQLHDHRQEDDASREMYLERLGLKVIRFRNDQVLNNPAEVASQILATLKTCVKP